MALNPLQTNLTIISTYVDLKKGVVLGFGAVVIVSTSLVLLALGILAIVSQGVLTPLISKEIAYSMIGLGGTGSLISVIALVVIFKDLSKFNENVEDVTCQLTDPQSSVSQGTYRSINLNDPIGLIAHESGGLWMVYQLGQGIAEPQLHIFSNAEQQKQFLDRRRNEGT